MGISQINDYAGLLANYRVPTIPSVSLDEVKHRDGMEQSIQPVAANTAESPVTSSDRIQRKDTPLEDVAISFNKGDDYSYLGKDSDIKSLDVQKAIDDMNRDRLLRQYQYFVGNRNVVTESEDGIVIQKM